MTREEIRAFAAEHNAGHDRPQPGYDLDPTSTDPAHWMAIAHQAYRRRDSVMLGWMWRWAPDIATADGRLLDRIDQLGMCSV